MEQLIYIIDNIFEGPLELLFFLVKEKKIEISDIPLIFIVNQFIGYIEKMNMLPLDMTANFISTISELVYIKSKILINKDEDEGFFVREENKTPLISAEKILEYKSLKDAFDKIINDNEKSIIPIFVKNQPEMINEDNQLWEPISIIDLFKHFELIISRLPKQKDFVISRASITVEEMIEKIKELLSEKEYLLFSDIISLYSSRIEFICLFLAILELVKSKFIKIYQIDHFTDIKILKTK